MTNRETEMQNVAASLVRLRTSAGLTQSELALKLNYTDKAISKWERGESLPDVLVLRQLCELYGVTLDSLFDPERAEKEKNLSKTVAAGYSLGSLHFTMTLKQLCITLLSVIGVWFVALLTFVVLKYTLPGAESTLWLCFMAALPLSFIVLLVFNSMWGSGLVNKVIISALIWTGLAFIFLLVLEVCEKNVWAIFLLGIPAEASLPLWHWLEYQAKSKK